MYNVTLRGGITSGTFRDRGKLPNMQECLRICCIAKSCDLAFMLSNHCFSVTCKNQTLCEVVTARTSGYKPQIAYIYARSNIENHQLNHLHAQGQSTESLHRHRKHHYRGQKSNRTLHNHKMDGSNDQSEKKKEKLNQVKLSKGKKKPHKRKKWIGKKNRRRKYSKNNRAKLEHMYAEERVLLRKLALLKLRMEILKKKNLGNDKIIKDNVLLEAFEDKPRISKKSWHKVTDSSTGTRPGNRTQKISKSSAVKSIRLKVKPSSSTFRVAEDKNRKQSSTGKLFILNRKTSRNNSTETNSISSRNERFLKSNSLLVGRNYLPNRSSHITPISPSFLISRTSSSSSHSVKMLANETGKSKTFSCATQGHPKSNMQHQNFLKKNRKQDKIGVASLQKAKKQYKEKETNIKNTNRTVSLEEMISQTTELENSNSDKTLRDQGNYEEKAFKKDEKVDKRVKNSSLSKGTVNIDRNISSSTSQPAKQPIQTRTLTKNDLSSSNEIINSNQDTANSDQEKKDLMLLNRLPLETAVNNDSQGGIKTTEKYTLQRNSSLRPFSRRKT